MVLIPTVHLPPPPAGSNAAKVQTALKLSQEDQQTIGPGPFLPLRTERCNGLYVSEGSLVNLVILPTAPSRKRIFVRLRDPKKQKEEGAKKQKEEGANQHRDRVSVGPEGLASNLKREIEKAWKMVDTTHEKEARARDTIQLLKKEACPPP